MAAGHLIDSLRALVNRVLTRTLRPEASRREKDRIWQHHGFVSYRRDDARAAGELTHRIQECGLRIWWDKDAGVYDQAPRQPGDVRGKLIYGDEDRVREELRSAIYASITVVVVTSRSTLSSTWVRKEITMARELGTPLFFWHTVDATTAATISTRMTGPPMDCNLPADEAVEAVARSGHYRKSYVASDESASLLRELSAQQGLNVVGHSIAPVSAVAEVQEELVILFELAELVLHHGEPVTAQTLQSHSREYRGLLERTETLTQKLYEQFGKAISVSRTPSFGDAFRLRRPFVLSRIAHLTRLLENEEFRRNEFTKLQD